MGDRVANCRKALARLAGGVSLTKKSSFYETPPWGNVEQEKFINCAVEITTELSPRELLGLLKGIEADLGRTPSIQWGPRVIDLDIIFYNGRVINEGGLTIPHPRAHERAFVLVPLSEIAPDFIHPLLKKSVSELAGLLKDKGGVKRIEAGFP